MNLKEGIKVYLKDQYKSMPVGVYKVINVFDYVTPESDGHDEWKEYNTRVTVQNVKTHKVYILQTDGAYNVDNVRFYPIEGKEKKCQCGFKSYFLHRIFSEDGKETFLCDACVSKIMEGKI